MMADKNMSLKRAMLDAGDIKAPALAKEVGIHVSNMYAILNGSLPHIRTAQMIVKVLREKGAEVTIDGLWPLPNEEEDAGVFGSNRDGNDSEEIH